MGGIEIPVKIAYTSIKYTLKMQKHSICGRFMAWFHIHCVRYMLPLFKCKLPEMILCEKRYVQRIWRFSIQTAAAHLKHTFAFHLQTAHLCFVYKFLAKDTLASLYKRYVFWLHTFRSQSDLSVAQPILVLYFLGVFCRMEINMWRLHLHCTTFIRIHLMCKILWWMLPLQLA